MLFVDLTFYHPNHPRVFDPLLIFKRSVLQGYADSLRDAPQMRAIAFREETTASALKELAKCLNTKRDDNVQKFPSRC